MLVVSLVAAGVAAELVLRWIGFSFSLAPERVEFGWPDPTILENTFVPDPDLFWVPPGYAQNLAILRKQRPDIAFLGDSCTQYSSYPARLVERIQADHPAANLVGARLGVGGWTTHQGLKQLVRDVLPLEPRVASFYFGWNDHWVGFGIEDKEINRVGTGRIRLGQLLLKTRLALQNRLRANRPLRVSLDDFRGNLREMVERSRASGVVPVLVTAPTSHREGRDPEMVSERFLADRSQLVPLHNSYVSAVRDVAAETDSILCDLAAFFDGQPAAARRLRYFYVDGIHLRPPGDEKAAGFLYDCFRSQPEIRAVFRGLPAGKAG
jgi:lysophospholipase L1-like esterase